MSQKQNFLEVTDGSEIKVEIADTYNETDSEWNFETIEYRRNIDPDMPEGTRDVYDRLNFRGKKPTRSENTLTIEQEFPKDFESGLYPYANQQGLLIKVTIEHHYENESAPESQIRYYTNWCTNQPEWSAPDEGEYNLTLSGTFDQETAEEPTGTEDWVETSD